MKDVREELFPSWFLCVRGKEESADESQHRHKLQHIQQNWFAHKEMKALLAVDEMKPALPTVVAIVLIEILEIIIGERTVLADMPP